MKSFLVITGHYYSTQNFQIQSTILDFSTFSKRHTAIEISQVLEHKLNELDISKKIVCVTADGAPNMTSAIKHVGLEPQRLWCIAHRLHLTISNAFGFWISKKKTEEDLKSKEQGFCFFSFYRVLERSIG